MLCSMALLSDVTTQALELMMSDLKTDDIIIVPLIKIGLRELPTRLRSVLFKT